MNRLFDPTPYGPETEHDFDHPPEKIVEDYVAPWRHVRTRRGMLPYTHLIKATLTHGSVVTMCGVKGSTITMDGVTRMIRCPSCDLAAQLS